MCLAPTKILLFTKFYDLKGVIFCVDFGEAEPIRLSTIGDNEPKDAEEPPFKAGSGFDAFASFTALTFCPF